MRRFITLGPALVVLAAVVVVVLAAPAAVRSIELSKIAADVTLAQTRLDQNTVLAQINQATRDVADAVMPGVVHIQARSQSRRVTDDDENRAEEPRRRTFPRASGSGWFFNDQGYIVTNAHVIEGADQLRVELHDGRVRTAEVIGADRPTDIAVLRVDVGPGVIPLRRGTGRALFVGDRVFAFGSPFGIKFSMSQGIISGLGRSEAAPVVGGISGYTNYIQTDAAINPGNSGGPLVDVHGRVVGVNAAIANGVNFQNEGSLQGQSAGIGFAIPIETVESVVEQLIRHDIVLRGFLGISLPIGLEFGPELVEAIKASEGVTIDYDGTGVLVTDVSSGQPADKAGLKKYDLILFVDDQPTPNSDVLRSMISVKRPGDRVTLKYFRDGEMRETVARLGAARQGRGPDGRPGLVYIDGSENMSLDEIRKRITASR